MRQIILSAYVRRILHASNEFFSRFFESYTLYISMKNMLHVKKNKKKDFCLTEVFLKI